MSAGFSVVERNFASLSTLLGLTSFTTHWTAAWKGTKRGQNWTCGRVKVPCYFGDNHPDSRARKRCHLGCSSCWEHRNPCHPPGSQPTCREGRAGSIQTSDARSDRVFRAERSQRISSKRRRAGLVKPPLGKTESQRLLATSPACQCESKAGVQQVLSCVDTLLAAVWEGFALVRGDMV